MPPKPHKAGKIAKPHAADQLVAPPHIIATVRRLLSSAPLKARSSEIVECLKGIDWADADVEFQRVQSHDVARMADMDGDHDADVQEFVLFLICRKLLKERMSMLSFCYTFGKCLCKWLRCIFVVLSTPLTRFQDRPSAATYTSGRSRCLAATSWPCRRPELRAA
jgi:hypothetical protein